MICHDVRLGDNQLIIGHVGENNVNSFSFDISEWVNDFGEGQAKLIMQRPQEQEVISIDLTVQDNKIIWIVSANELLKSGKGYIQLMYSTSNRVIKSKIYKVIIKDSIF